MKTNIWLKIEVIGLLIGLLGSIVFATGSIYWNSLPAFIQKFFFGGQYGAMLIGLLVLIGIFSSVLYFVNLLYKRLSLWWFRFLGFLVFYLALAMIGASTMT